MAAPTNAGPKAVIFGGGHEPSRLLPGVRAHETALVRTDDRLDFGALRAAAKTDGQKLADVTGELVKRRRTAVRQRRLGNFTVDHEAENLSFGSIANMRALRAAFDFNVTVQVPNADGQGTRAVTTSAFTLLTSNMAVADVNTAYESVPTVSEFLIGRELDDNAPNTEIGAALDFGHSDVTDLPKPMSETEKFREIGAGEERYTILELLDGFQVAFSQTFIDRSPALVQSQLMDLGTHARDLIEARSLLKITDHFGSATANNFHAMIRNRAAAALFSATANTPSTRTPSGTRITNNALVDDTDLANLRIRLATMRKPSGFPIAQIPRVILVPSALWETAWKILNAQLVAGVFNEPNFYGPGGPMGGMMLLTSPILDRFSSTAWYGGDPTKVFVRKWALRPEVATLGGSGTEAYLHTREAMRVRIAWNMDVGVRDHVAWIQSLTASTAPADE